MIGTARSKAGALAATAFVHAPVLFPAMFQLICDGANAEEETTEESP
jgi:hypothetical protein